MRGSGRNFITGGTLDVPHDAKTALRWPTDPPAAQVLDVPLQHRLGLDVNGVQNLVCRSAPMPPIITRSPWWC